MASPLDANDRFGFVNCGGGHGVPPLRVCVILLLQQIETAAFVFPQVVSDNRKKFDANSD